MTPFSAPRHQKNAPGALFGRQPGEPAIDLVHLARQTMSDAALEIELLALFDRQSAKIAAQLTGAEPCAPAARAELAHRLRGSALAIGAGRVARAARACEELSSAETATNAAWPEAARELAAAVAEARAAIAALRG